MSKLFKSSRIQLTSLSAADAGKYVKWGEDDEYLRNLDTDYVRPRNEDFYKSQIQSFAAAPGIIEFGIYALEEKELIGFISLFSIEWNNRLATLAVGIGDANFRGKGFGSEAIQLVLNYAFNELNLNKVVLDVISNNEGAISSYRKNGFIVEGTARESILRDGNKYDKIYMGILKREWLALNRLKK